MRYNTDEIRKRISDKTFEGMSLNIDDLGAIGRVLSIQDDAYDDQFDQIYAALKLQKDTNKEILDTLKELKQDISELKAKVNGLEGKIGELTKTVNCTRDEVDDVKKKVDRLDQDVQRLKRINSPWFYVGRIAVGVVIGLGLVGLVFGLF